MVAVVILVTGDVYIRSEFRPDNDVAHPKRWWLHVVLAAIAQLAHAKVTVCFQN